MWWFDVGVRTGFHLLRSVCVCSLTQLFGSWPPLWYISICLLKWRGWGKKTRTGQHSRNVFPLCGSLPLCVYGWCRLSLPNPPIACPLPPGECLWPTVCRRWVKHCFGKISVKLVELEAIKTNIKTIAVFFSFPTPSSASCFVVTLSDSRIVQTYLHRNH